jgi:hypothetical protein
MCHSNQARFAADVPKPFGGTFRDDHVPDDWSLVSTASSNVWFKGDRGTTADLVDALRPHLAEPVIIVRSGDSLVLPNVNEVGTLVLLDVEALGLGDQHRLNAWLDRSGSRPRMISASRASVLPMIQAGTFLESLYYRLNTLCLDVDIG